MSDFQFKDNSENVKRQMQANIDRALLKAAMLIQGQAKANVRSVNGSGHLRDSIIYVKEGSGDETVMQIGSGLTYAMYQEFGTGEFAENGAGRKGGWIYKAENGKFYHTTGVKPQKFMRDAFRANKGRVKDIISQEMGNGLS
jgi:HK97 gp10 family phage protein